MPFCEPQKPLRRTAWALSLLTACSVGFGASAATPAVTPEQRATADKVAHAGVPLSELVPDAPDSHTVKPGDTLWDISRLFLKSPWRWPELWGMNREQIANPHLIFPGQVLLLVKIDGRASLQLAQGQGGAGGDGTVKLSPQVRSSAPDGGPIAAIPLTLIVPFLDNAVVFDTDELATAPRIVAVPDGHVLLSRGDKAYARGDLSQATDYRIFRNTTPLLDPSTGEVLGFEAPYLGTAELTQPDQSRTLPDGRVEVVPATLQIKSVRKEIGVGDRLSPVPQRSFDRYIPHAPANPVAGQIVSIYGEALNAGQNQIVALNRGLRDGMERGHVLALWAAGRRTLDRTVARPEEIQLPDERQGILFVFQVYERVSYALIVTAKDAIRVGDRFTQP
jgi:hypothetical protein